MPNFTDYPRTETIYNYDDDGVYLSTQEKLIPVGTDIPAKSTTIEPPSGTGRRVPVFNESTQLWSLVNDFRNVDVFDTSSGQKTKVETLGDLPENLTENAPDEEGDDETEIAAKEWNGSTWVVNIRRFRRAAIERVNDAASRARTRGFETLGASETEINHLTRVMDTWVNDGSDLGSLPSEVAVHVDDGGLTPTEAVALVQVMLTNANDIEREVYVQKTNGLYAIQNATARGQIRAAARASIIALNGAYR